MFVAEATGGAWATTPVFGGMCATSPEKGARPAGARCAARRRPGRCRGGRHCQRTPPGRVGLTRVTMITAGGDNAMAACTQSLYSTLTTLMTWGPDAYGELGTGTGITYTLTPVAVTAIPAGSIRSMSMGGLETAMVLFTDGSVWEWGDPGYGQIPGAPANRGVSTPTETMAPGSGITQVSAGYTHVLALRSDGTVLAWGDDDIGQLGNGTTTSVLSGPVQVTGLTNATQVAAGAGYSLAIHETLSYRGPLTR